jgi:hypothetical protein
MRKPRRRIRSGRSYLSTRAWPACTQPATGASWTSSQARPLGTGDHTGTVVVGTPARLETPRIHAVGDPVKVFPQAACPVLGIDDEVNVRRVVRLG